MQPTLNKPGSPAEGDEEQLRRLARIPGLDLDRGLATVRGNLTKYMSLLVLFTDQSRGHVVRISESLLAGDVAVIDSIAHSLIGTASMLGALKLSQAAGAVLSAVRHEVQMEEIRQLGSAMAEELASLVAGIRNAVAEPVEAADVAVDATHFGEVLTRLEDFLERGDIAACYLAKEEARLLRAALGQAANPLLARIEAFDYESAADLLRDLRRHSNGATERQI